MRITDYDIQSLRKKIEQEGGFQVAITPVFPGLFENVRVEANILHEELEQAGYSVLMDDRNQKPRNMFAVIEFLDVPHRLTLSGRSLEAGVYEYFNSQTAYREKIKRADVLEFLAQALADDG